MPDLVSYELVDNVAVITIDNPPVNAVSRPVRQGIQDAYEKFKADAKADAAILLCAGRTFIAGADITEFEKPPEDPWLPQLIDRLETVGCRFAWHGSRRWSGNGTGLSLSLCSGFGQGRFTGSEPGLVAWRRWYAAAATADRSGVCPGYDPDWPAYFSGGSE